MDEQQSLNHSKWEVPIVDRGAFIRRLAGENVRGVCKLAGFVAAHVVQNVVAISGKVALQAYFDNIDSTDHAAGSKEFYGAFRPTGLTLAMTTVPLKNGTALRGLPPASSIHRGSHHRRAGFGLDPLQERYPAF